MLCYTNSLCVRQRDAFTLLRACFLYGLYTGIQIIANMRLKEPIIIAIE